MGAFRTGQTESAGFIVENCGEAENTGASYPHIAISDLLLLDLPLLTVFASVIRSKGVFD